jgi:hypothetical protein
MTFQLWIASATAVLKTWAGEVPGESPVITGQYLLAAQMRDRLMWRGWEMCCIIFQLDFLTFKQSDSTSCLLCGSAAAET